jgi:hypothetical protein
MIGLTSPKTGAQFLKFRSAISILTIFCFTGLIVPSIKGQSGFVPLGVEAEADAGAASVQLKIHLPLVGWNTIPFDQSPIGEAETPAVGGATDKQVDDVNVSLGTLPIIVASGIHNDSQDSGPGTTVSALATSNIAEATLLGGLIHVKGLVATVNLNGQLEFGATVPFVTHASSVYAEEVTIAGVSYDLASVAPNTAVSLAGALQARVLGIDVNIPISGTVTLNQQEAVGPNGFWLNAVRVQAKGSIPAVASITVDIILGGPGADAEPGASEPNREICKEPGGFYQDATNCSRFYQCDLAYRPYLLTCPDGLVFNDNPKVLVCDWPDTVLCHTQSSQPAQAKLAVITDVAQRCPKPSVQTLASR